MKLKHNLLIVGIAAIFNLQAQCYFSVKSESCVNQTILITSNFGNDDIVSWSINGDLISNNKNPSYVFSTPGVKYIKMYVTNDFGEKCFGQKFITIKPLPTIQFGIKDVNQNLCNNSLFCFIDSSFSNAINGKIKRRLFSFDNSPFDVLLGDGKKDLFKVLKNENGSKIGVTIIVEDSNGCSDSKHFPQIITIKKQINPLFLSNKPKSCDSANMCIQNRSLIRLADVKSFIWRWGDNSESFGDSNSVALWGVDGFCHKFKTQGPNKGIFNTKLIVNDVFGCSDSFEVLNSATNFIVKNKILASFDSICFSDGNISFRLKDTIYEASNPLFNFGDPGSGGLNSARKWGVSHKFTKPGAYKINFTYSHSLANCIQALFDTILVIGPQTMIDEPGLRVLPQQRFQWFVKDTIQFVNGSVFFHNDNKFADDDSVIIISKDSLLVNKLSGVILNPSNTIFDALVHKWVKPGFNAPLNHSFNGQVSLKSVNQNRGNSNVSRLWDFADEYCETCTTDTKIGLNVGKNCRYSKDSLPKHFYTPWDTIYEKYYSRNAYLLSEYKRDSGTVYYRKIWADDSLAIIRDTILYYGANAFGNSAKDSIVFGSFSKKIKISSGGSGVLKTFFERDAVIYMSSVDTIDISSDGGINWTKTIGPTYAYLEKGYQIKINSNQNRFYNVYQIEYINDTIPLSLLETKHRLWKKIRNPNYLAADSIDANLHRQAFYRSDNVLCFDVKLTQMDLKHPLLCQDEKTMKLSLYPNSARRLRKEGVQCFGAGNKYGITFILDDSKASCSRTWAEINFDTSMNKKAWVPLVGPNLGGGYVSEGNLPPSNPPYLGYAYSGEPGFRFSKQYIKSEVKDNVTGFVNVGLIIGSGYWVDRLNNGFNTSNYGYPQGCFDTFYFNKFARFPVLENKFRIIKKKEGNPFTSICRKDTISVTTNKWNRTFVPDVASTFWSFSGNSIGRDFNDYYALTVREKYERFKTVAGNPNILEDYLTVTKEQVYNLVSTVLSEKRIKVAVISKWHTEADISKVFDLVRTKLDANGIDIYDLTPSKMNELIWNGVGVLNKPFSGSRGCVDTTGFGHLIQFSKVADEKMTLHFRDTSIMPIDTAIGWDGKQYNAYSFVPQYSGLYFASFSLNSFAPNNCITENSDFKKVVVGFYSSLKFTDTIINPGSPIVVSPEFRYYNPDPMNNPTFCKVINTNLLNCRDFWRERVGLAGNVGMEAVIKWDLNKDDDDIHNPITIFGGYPYSMSGTGIPEVRIAGFYNSMYYNKDTGYNYLLRVSAGDSTGCRDTFEQNIYTISAKVNFDLKKSTPFCQNKVELTNLTKIEDPGVQKFGKAWFIVKKTLIDWGDGNISTFLDSMPEKATHNYTYKGPYKIKLSIEPTLQIGYVTHFYEGEKEINFSGAIPFFDTNISPYYFVNDLVEFKNLSIYNRADSAVWKWDFGDGKSFVEKDTVYNQSVEVTHRYAKQGRYAVYLKMTVKDADNGFCTYYYPDINGSKKFYLNILDSNVTAVRSVLAKGTGFDAKILPNPNNGEFKLKLINLQSDQFNITIKNYLGKMVYQKQMKIKVDEVGLNVNFLSKGLYFISIESENQIITQKLIIH